MSLDEHIERLDILTGCPNLLSFLETFSARLSSSSQAFSLLLLDLNNFMAFNDEYGQEQGDSVLHWVGIVLRDTGLPVFRIGGDEFLLSIDGERPEECERIARAVFQRLNRESRQFHLGNPPASVILIHFQKEELEIADLWIAISDALFDAKVFGQRGFLVNTYTQASAINRYQLRVINMLTERLLSLANRLDTTHQIAYVDSITQLPNNMAAEREMKRVIQQSQRTSQTFSVLFIDGDNLRLYNDISYSAGDNMLKRLAELLSSNLRPGDFIARWRVGDEFLVLLPATTKEEAFIVAERLRSQVQLVSQTWEIPTTISIGISVYPSNGTTVEELLQAVEKAAKESKDNGKNQITTCAIYQP